MFVEFSKMLEKSGSALALNIVALDDGRLSVTVMPKGEWKNAAMGTPLCVKGTPEELDEQLPAQIKRFVQARVTLEDQVNDTLKVIEAATKETKDKAGAAIKKATTAGTSTTAVKPTVAKSSAPAVQPQPADGGDDDEIDLF